MLRFWEKHEILYVIKNVKCCIGGANVLRLVRYAKKKRLLFFPLNIIDLLFIIGSIIKLSDPLT